MKPAKTTKTQPQVLPAGQARTVHYPGGTTRYFAVGHPGARKTMVVVVPGFSRGLAAFYRFAQLLNKSSHRQVIVLDQPEHHSLIDNLRHGHLSSGLSSLDHQSEALLAVLQDNHLDSKPVDFIAHSFGALVLWRASELGNHRGFKSFSYENGSHSIFLAPSGTYEYEDITKLGRRFLRHMRRRSRKGVNTSLDTLKQLESKKSLMHTLVKYLREALTLSRERIPYSTLHKTGLNPMIFSYSNDVVFPHEILSDSLKKHKGHIYGYAMISGPDAHHDDPIFRPERTIRAVVPELNRPNRR